MIVKLTESIEDNKKDNFDLKSLYGAWDDKRTSDEIIDEIKSSRIDKKNFGNL